MTRLSHYTIMMMIILDASTCLTLLAISIAVPQLYLPLVSTSFLLFVLFSIFELKFGVGITSVRGNNMNQSFLQIYITIIVAFMLLYEFALQIMLVSMMTGVLFNLFWVPQIIKYVFFFFLFFFKPFNCVFLYHLIEMYKIIVKKHSLGSILS